MFVKRREHKELFDQAFHVFWKKPKMLEQLMQLLFQQITASGRARKPRRRASAAWPKRMFDRSRRQSRREEKPGALELDASFTAFGRGSAAAKDFEQMTVAEQAQARRAIAGLRLHRVEIRTRRFRPAAQGERIDLRRTLRRSLRAGGHLIDLERRERADAASRRSSCSAIFRARCSNYSRMFLHFLHALMNDRERVQVFLFGTRLTNITRELERRDVDEALTKVSAAVKDWSGGTRIGSAIKEFNYHWARRVLDPGRACAAHDRRARPRAMLGLLGAEMARLARSARRIVWLNPLLRFEGFEARAAGIRAIMPHVDEFRPVHSLESLEDLARALAYSAAGRARCPDVVGQCRPPEDSP